MDCRTVSSKTQAFFDDALSYRDTKEFVRHVSSCEKCRKDTELLYMFRTANEMIGGQKPSNFDFSHLLDDRMNAVKKRIRKRRLFTFLVAVLLTLLLAVLTTILFVYIGR